MGGENTLTDGVPQGGSVPMPFAQDASDMTPVANVPASAVPLGMHIPNATGEHERAGAILKVHGEDVPVGYDQLVRLGQKGMAADQNFQAAAAKEKEAESAIQLKDDMQLVTESGDPEAFRRVGESLGLSRERIEATLTEIDKQFEAGEAGAAAPGSRQAPAQQTSGEFASEVAKVKALIDNKKSGYEDLTPDLQLALKYVEEGRISKIVGKALDNDEVVRYYMSSYDDKGKEAVRGLIDEKIRGRLDNSDGQFGDGEILKGIIPEVRALLEAVGTPGRTTPPMGLGPSPAGSRSSIYPTKPPEHMSSTSPGFEEHIVEQLNFNISKSG